MVTEWQVCDRVGERNRSHTQTHNKNNTTHDTTRTTPQQQLRVGKRDLLSPPAAAEVGLTVGGSCDAIEGVGVLVNGKFALE